jgi:hypothetical protein
MNHLKLVFQLILQSHQVCTENNRKAIKVSRVCPWSIIILALSDVMLNYFSD